jgi:hypothetical protein
METVLVPEFISYLKKVTGRALIGVNGLPLNDAVSD